MKISVAVAIACLSASVIAANGQAHAISRKFELSIPQQTLEDALQELSRQTGLQIARFSDTIDGSTLVGPISGEHSAEQALKALLAPTGLSFKVISERTIAIVQPNAPRARVFGESSPVAEEAGPPRTIAGSIRIAQAANSESAAATEGETSAQEPDALKEFEVTARGIPEILVKGSRSLNLDIRRTEDETQPYVVFDREHIERSGAKNLDEFFRDRLTASATSYIGNQAPSLGARSSINLRGLGDGQTLILVDGRRIGSAARAGAPLQPDLNSIPLASIERIEVLPATASGIYGGGATGGVINIIRRRNFSGTQLALTYDNSFDTDSASRRVEAGGGFQLEGGRTQIHWSGSFYDANPLTVGDRDFMRRAREKRLVNNPAQFLGTPPLGATTNIRSQNGSPLFGPGTPNFTHVPAGYTRDEGLAPLQENAGQYNLELADTAQVDGGAGQYFFGTPKTKSAAATVRRSFSPRIEVFVDALWSDSESIFYNDIVATALTVPANAPTNPFGQAVVVRVPNRLDDQRTHTRDGETRLVGGVMFDLPARWRGEIDYTWNRSTTAFTGPQGVNTQALNAALADGTLDPFRDTNLYPLDLTPYLSGPVPFVDETESILRNTTLRLSGPALSLPGGDVWLTALLERRDEEFGGGNSRGASPVPQFDPDRSQVISSFYVEANAPIVSERNAMRGVRALELQMAVRYDNYRVRAAQAIPIGSTVGEIEETRTEMDSTNPTLGVKYQPLQDVTFRASYGKGFLPPLVNQVVPSARQSLPATTGIRDPLRGNAPLAFVEVISGGNPTLTPEESKSWSAGLILTPRFVPGLRVSVDFVRIDKTDNIAMHPQGAQGIVNDAALFPERVVRGEKLPGDPEEWPGPITFLDTTLMNIAQSEVEAFDFQVDYALETQNWGTFELFAIGSRQTHYRTQLLPHLPVTENVGISFNNPVKLKANAGVTWKRADLTLGWNSRYIHDYVVSTNARLIQDQGEPKVPSQHYHDIFARYEFGAQPWAQGILSNTEVTLAIENVFNKEPPYDASFTGGYYYSPYGDPRLATYSISLKKSF
jgi:iron complex outermembrane receptor protein